MDDLINQIPDPRKRAAAKRTHKIYEQTKDKSSNQNDTDSQSSDQKPANLNAAPNKVREIVEQLLKDYDFYSAEADAYDGASFTETKIAAQQALGKRMMEISKEVKVNNKYSKYSPHFQDGWNEAIAELRTKIATEFGLERNEKN